jgi:hypothetical protein
MRDRRIVKHSRIPCQPFLGASGVRERNPKSEYRNPKPKENPKSEYRNPKQIQITKKENPKQRRFPVLDLGDSDFGFVSDFGIRVPDFAPLLARRRKANQ